MNRQTGAILLVSLGALMLALLSLASPATSGAGGLAVGWQTETPLPDPLSGGLGLVAASQRLVTLGGQSSPSGSPVTSVLRNQIDPWGNPGGWESGGDTPLSAPRALHASVYYAHASGDRACVIGGWNGSGALASVQCAPTDAAGHVVGTWQSGPSLPDGPRMNLGAAVADRGLVYVAGGWDWFKPRDEVYVSVIQTNGLLGSWLPVSRLDVPLFGLSLSAHGDYLYVAGGHDGSGARREVYRAQMVDALGNLAGWTRLPSANDLPAARERHAAVVYQDHLLLLGGRDAGGASTDTVFAAAIDTAGSLGNWVEDYVSAMPRKLDRHAAVVIEVPNCGQVIYIAGGRGDGSYESDVYRTGCTLTDPWSAWKATGAPSALLVCPATRVSILYGNQTVGKRLVAKVNDGSSGPVVFDDDSYTRNYDLIKADDAYDLILKPAPSSAPGQEFTLSATIDDAQVGSGSLSGKTAECTYLPLVLRNGP